MRSIFKKVFEIILASFCEIKLKNIWYNFSIILWDQNDKNIFGIISASFCEIKIWWFSFFFFAGWQVWSLDPTVRPCLPPPNLVPLSFGPLAGTSFAFKGLHRDLQLNLRGSPLLQCNGDHRRLLEFNEMLGEIMKRANPEMGKWFETIRDCFLKTCVCLFHHQSLVFPFHE